MAATKVLAAVKEEPHPADDEASASVYAPEKLAAIQQLKVDPSNARFMLLVDDLLRPESLPRGWSAEFSDADAKWVYKDKAGVLHDKHPVHGYYIGAMFMDLGGYAQLKANAAARPPSAEEVQQMGQYFGIKQDEDKYIWEVAEMGLCAPLPPSWKEEVVQQPGEPTPSLAFRQEETGEVQQEHPLDDYFRELIRRRRRELLRRKKAALRSLQALVKMGMGRRSMLAAVAAAAGSSSQQQQQHDSSDDDEGGMDGWDPKTLAALQQAWQGLLSTASHLVQCMQAAAWDGTASLAADTDSTTLTSASTDSISSSSTSPTAKADSCSAQQSVNIPCALDSAHTPAPSSSSSGSHAREAQDQLRKLSVVLSDATAGSVLSDPVSQAGLAEALAHIQHLAAQVAAAGTHADALAAVLTGQGLQLPQHLLSIADYSRCSAAKPCSILEGSGQAGHHSAGSSRGSSRRPSRTSFEGPAADGSCPAKLAQRRASLLGDALPFVGADGGTASTAGAVSSAGYEAWSLAGGRPDEARQAAAACARGTAAARAAAAATAGPGSAATADKAGGDDEREVQFAVAFDAAAAAGAAAAGGGVLGVATAPTAAARLGGADAASPQLSLIHGSTEFPPAAEAALQQLTTLQAVMQQALALINSWQLQRVIIALLQQRLQQAVGAARSSQHRLAATRHELHQLQAQQELHAAQAASVAQHCSQLAEQLQQAQRELAAAAEGKQDLEQRLSEALSQLASKEDALQSLQAASETADAAAAASRTAAFTQLQDTIQQLQAELAAAHASVAAAQDCSVQLEQQLAAVTAQLTQEQADKQAALQQLQSAREQCAALQASYERLSSSSGSQAAATHGELQQLKRCLQEAQELTAQREQQLAAVTAQLTQEQADKQAALQQLQQSSAEIATLHANYEQLLSSTGSEAAAALAELQHLRSSLQELQGTHNALLQEHTTALATAAAAAEQQQALQQQLSQAQQQLVELLAAHAALQAEHAAQGQQLVAAEAALQALRESKEQQGTELTSAQQQFAALQSAHAAALAQQQRLQDERSSLQAQQDALQANLTSTQAELASVQAAAAAADAKRAAMPHKSSQVSATDHAALHWVSSKGVQTGQELDPRSKKDAATPADLSLLSYFFREIKQKQRGGGGAILGYDPKEAADAASGPAPFNSAKSWSGGSGLPPIAANSAAAGGKDGKAGAAGARSPQLTKRPATMPGGRRPEEDEQDSGGFNTRPPPWEVRQRVDRRRDRGIKLEAAGHAADGDKWDYAQDERDTEIAELKKRLVEAEHKAKEAAGKAADELKVLASDLQTCKRSLEQVQADNFTLNKDLVSLKLAMQAVELADGSSTAVAGGVSGDAYSAPRVSMFVAGLPGLRPQGPRASTAQGLGSPTDAKLGFSSPGTRGSVAFASLQGGAGPGGFSGGRASSLQQYGTGRLSALPTGLSASAPQLPTPGAAGQAGQGSSPYAASARKSVSASHS